MVPESIKAIKIKQGDVRIISGCQNGGVDQRRSTNEGGIRVPVGQQGSVVRSETIMEDIRTVAENLNELNLWEE